MNFGKKIIVLGKSGAGIKSSGVKKSLLFAPKDG